MSLSARRASLTEVANLRERCLQEATCQIVRWSFVTRGFAYPVVIEDASRVIGFAAIKTTDEEETLVQLYSTEGADPVAAAKAVMDCTEVPLMEAQTNVPVMRQILETLGRDPVPGPLLFSLGTPTHLPPCGANFRSRGPTDELFSHTREPEGTWVIEVDGRVVATGGYFTHYNPPYADLYMEVEASSRRSGYGSFLLQELIRVCKSEGLVPAARCDRENVASARCLLRAGMQVCGELVTARIRP